MFFQWFKCNSEKIHIKDYTNDDMLGLTQVATSAPKYGRQLVILKDETLNVFYKKVILKWEVTKKIQLNVMNSHACIAQRKKIGIDCCFLETSDLIPH